MNEGQPQGAFVGEDKTAQEIYETLQKGGVFSPKPGGNPPIGGDPFPKPGEVVQVPSVKEIPQGVGQGGLKGLLMEVKELRKEIQQLLEVLKGL